MRRFLSSVLILLIASHLAIGQEVPPDPIVPSAPLEPPSAPTAPLEPPEPLPPPVLPVPVPQSLPLELLIETREPELINGRVLEVRQTKRVALPIASVAVSRTRQTLSSGLIGAINRLAQEVGQPSRDARFYRRGQTWVAQQTSAWRVDLPATRQAVLVALQKNQAAAKAVLLSTSPKRTVADFSRRGIRFYFGGGNSNFAGSPSYRVANIIAAAKQLDARYLEPKAIFSFNQSITLSAKAGFVLGNIIRGKNLVKELGGGICQVSTTVWRAAYQAGLPILERHQHSYRVAYYDPPGYEATVFAPSKNLRFRNDTKAALWLQLDWDSTMGNLELNFFGAAPDRQVQISEPRLSAERPAPKDRFVPDASLKLGDIKIISGAEKGLQSRIDRAVRYNSGRIQRDTTQSLYVPWAAIYAVHPKDPRAKK